jgi:hypothetical protein
LCIVDDAGAAEPSPHADFDPILAAVDFSFKVACPSDFDCQPDTSCPVDLGRPPEINYLAKDYASFRQLLLDRLAVLMPPWRERNAADVGIALVELMAYVGDYLSYQQDAVATEAYLRTARRRVSVKRHARLVDYHMHDGKNARAWVHVCVTADGKLPKGTPVLSRLPQFPTQIPSVSASPVSSAEYDKALAANPIVFETAHEATLYEAHNKMYFHTWGDEQCCLPRGATHATLEDDGRRLAALEKKDVLVFVEERNPQNGKVEEADRTHRHAVRLTEVTPRVDTLLTKEVLDIQWAAEDALPFPLCLWKVRDKDRPEDEKQPASVVLGNIVLADHGLTVTAEELGTVPAPNEALDKVVAGTGSFCVEQEPKKTPVRFRPHLQYQPLTQSAPCSLGGEDDQVAPLSAREEMNRSQGEFQPAIGLKGERDDVTSPWEVQRDLLSSGPDKREFVVEAESDGIAFLRFGDDRYGARPNEGTKFTATYRVGNGAQGNVGADSLVHVVTTESAESAVIDGVSNPLPAQGGMEPESINEVRQYAPAAFRRQERAVTEADYAAMAERCGDDVQHAAATFRWTGSWYSVFLTADRTGGKDVDDEFKTQMSDWLERYRMAGHDVKVDSPTYVSLEIEMIICIDPGYHSSDVNSALLDVFSNRTLPDGRRGVFHPDNFTFGQPAYLSPLYAAAQSVAGVTSVEITTFQRQGDPSNDALDSGKLEMDRLEIARLDNDRNFPEHGKLTLTVRGGR